VHSQKVRKRNWEYRKWHQLTRYLTVKLLIQVKKEKENNASKSIPEFTLTLVSLTQQIQDEAEGSQCQELCIHG